MSSNSFSRVAILNRGEAAIRFMRAAGTWSRIHGEPLETVVFYTAPDQSALFVRRAAQAINLGEAMETLPDGSQRSAYLNVKRVIELTKQAGATAIWPGWGFLAESPELADACAEADITLIGPSAAAMRLLGDKIAAKRMAEQNGVPVTAWSNDPVESPEDAIEVANRIGCYPVLVKAAAGGGGRGIRVVQQESEMADAFHSASHEAAAAFGDASLLVEQMVTTARHIEVQILADTHDNVWALGTRDCSMQRRHQKLIEEAPAPGLASEIESAMCDAAVRVARASGYVGAGTAEFLLEPDTQKFYFLEMNTRLQVEHTISEEIYGVDLVVKQISVAKGEALPSATPPSPRGTAIELRLNAENPDDNFSPSAGTVVRFEAPQGPGIRVDSGYATGDTVPTLFDSNLAKVIAWGADRTEAYARLRTVLHDTVIAIEGGPTNRSLLMELIRHEEVQRGPITTRWLDHYLTQRPPPEKRSLLAMGLAAAAIGDHLRSRRGSVLNFFNSVQRGLPQRSTTSGTTRWRYVVGKTPVSVSVFTVGAGRYRARCGDHAIELKAYHLGPRSLMLETTAGKRHSVIRIGTASAVYVEVEGVAHRFTRRSDGNVLAPIPAAVTGVHVQVGDRVEMGTRLATLEAMKMESPVEATLAGVVTQIHVDTASRVAAGETLITIEEESQGNDDQSTEELTPFVDEEPPAFDPLTIFEAAFLGYDVEPEVLDEAINELEKEPGSHSRGELLKLLEVVVTQEQLFQRGAYDDAQNDAGEDSADQLARFIRHPQGDEDALSERFKMRLDAFLALHGVPGRRERTFRMGASFLRLFQGHQPPKRLQRMLFAVVAATMQAEDDQPTSQVSSRRREVLEKFAYYAVQVNRRLAQTVWQSIYVLCDQPRMLQAQQKQDTEANAAFEALVAPGASNDSQEEARDTLLDLPIAALLGLMPLTTDRDPSVRKQLLSVMTEHIYHNPIQESVDDIPSPQIAAIETETDHADQVIGALVTSRDDLAVVGPLLNQTSAADLYLAFAPEEDEVKHALRDVRVPMRITVLWGNSADGGKARTYQPSDEGPEEIELYRDLHPARATARELELYSAFELTRLPAPAGMFLALASAREDSGDQRLIAIGEVERFDPEYSDTGTTVHLPSFEKAYLDAVYAMSQAITIHTAGGAGEKTNRKTLVWNRITLFFRPIVRLHPKQIHAVSERLSPWATGLGLEKVTVHSRFILPNKKEVPRRMVVQWSDPTHRGAVIGFSRPGREPIAVLSGYERRVVEARRRGKFYPYELIRTLTSNGPTVGFAEGSFEELDLDPAGTRLVPVDRPYGCNTANLVVGRIVNFNERFADGLTRILLVGDPTRSMGALAEPECARVIAAIDLAEEMGVPVEWVPISSGAKIAFDSGTENLDWTARVLKRIIEFTQIGGTINIIVDGICVGAQSYWNAEATMLMHCRGALIMTPQGCMLLTGKRALEHSGSVSAATNQGIGGLHEIMGPNGQAQYAAPNLRSAYDLLFRHYELTYTDPKTNYVSHHESMDQAIRLLSDSPYASAEGFANVSEIFTDEHNPGRKRPFAIREVVHAVLDDDITPLERWPMLEGGESSVVCHGQLGGWPVTCIGIESRPSKRRGDQPLDGPDSWTSGTLFPKSSWKVARAINDASGRNPVLVLANLSGFDGSPESMRNKQLEFGAEIGRAVVNFDGPILFCVIARYHGGAYVVFSQALSDNLQAIALEGSYASVIGGGPAAAVVFPQLVRKRVQADERVQQARGVLQGSGNRSGKQAEFEAIYRQVEAEIQNQVAQEFDGVHSIARAREVGSLSDVVNPNELRAQLCERLEASVSTYLDKQ